MADENFPKEGVRKQRPMWSCGELCGTPLAERSAEVQRSPCGSSAVVTHFGTHVDDDLNRPGHDSTQRLSEASARSWSVRLGTVDADDGVVFEVRSVATVGSVAVT